jgi:hypothetical protein
MGDKEGGKLGEARWVMRTFRSRNDSFRSRNDKSVHDGYLGFGEGGRLPVIMQFKVVIGNMPTKTVLHGGYRSAQRCIRSNGLLGAKITRRSCDEVSVDAFSLLCRFKCCEIHCIASQKKKMPTNHYEKK